MSVNTYTIDEERRLAHRGELKRAIAKNEVAKQRIAELEKLIAKLDEDTDAAESEHQTATSKLQGELDTLDAEHVEAILNSKKAPAASLKRRTEILQELADLNTELESRCDANRRSAKPIQKEINALRLQLAEGANLAGRLANLCSPETRRERLYNNLRMRMATATLKEAERVVGICEKNVGITKDNERRRVAGEGDTTIAAAKLADWQFVAAQCQAEIGAIHKAEAELQQKAMAE